MGANELIMMDKLFSDISPVPLARRFLSNDQNLLIVRNTQLSTHNTEN